MSDDDPECTNCGHAASCHRPQYPSGACGAVVARGHCHCHKFLARAPSETPEAPEADAFGLLHDSIHRDVGRSRAAYPVRHTISNAAVGGEQARDGAPSRDTHPVSAPAPAAAEAAPPGGPPEGLVPDRDGFWWRADVDVRFNAECVEPTWVWINDGRLEYDDEDGERGVVDDGRWRGRVYTQADVDRERVRAAAAEAKVVELEERLAAYEDPEGAA